MSGHFKLLLILALVITALLLPYEMPTIGPTEKDASRLDMDGSPASVTANQSGKAIDDRLSGVGNPDRKGESVEYKAEPARPRRDAMAVENVQLAHGSCGIELTALAQNMIAVDKAATARPFTDERAVLATLWRETFACNPDFAGENCFAARWQMCQRAYEEYGPDGIRLKGLIKAIVKK